MVNTHVALFLQSIDEVYAEAGQRAHTNQPPQHLLQQQQNLSSGLEQSQFQGSDIVGADPISKAIRPNIQEIASQIKASSDGLLNFIDNQLCVNK